MSTYDELTKLDKKPSPPREVDSGTKNNNKKSTQEITRLRTPSRDTSSEISRDFPSRNEVQEFSFRLRDELKVKVQAEVPHRWQKELEDLARELNVKKLELYRFILGEFLGKVKRGKPR